MRHSTEQTKASNITARTLAVFINEGTQHALRVCEIAKRIKEDYHAVYSAIRRFCKHGFIIKKPIGFRKSNYLLKDKDRALKYLDPDLDLAFLGEVPRSPFGDWIDLGRSVYECGVVRFRVDGYSTGRVRGFLEVSKAKASPKDPSKQLSYNCKSFSLVITKDGHVTLRIKSLQNWLGDFFDFLVSCGLNDGNRIHVFRKLAEKIDSTQIKVEAPILSDIVPKVTIETRVGDEKLVSRIASSHYARELEVTGGVGPLQNFLSALAGTQHFSMLEWVQADKLAKILEVLYLDAKSHEKVAGTIEALIDKPTQREPNDGNKKTYVV